MNLHYSYGSKMLCKEKKTNPEFKNIFGNLSPSGGRSCVARWLCGHMTMGAGHRCCHSSNSSSWGFWLLPLGSVSPDCHGCFCAMGSVRDHRCPGGWPTSGVGTSSSGVVLLWFCIFWDQTCSALSWRACLGAGFAIGISLWRQHTNCCYLTPNPVASG